MLIFPLEILVHKAKTALDRYSHNLVIGNLLSTRKWEVVFVAPGRPDKWIRIPNPVSGKPGHKRSLSEMEERKTVEAVQEDRPMDPSLLPEGDPDVEIESLIIPALEEAHTSHIREAKARATGNGKA